MNNAWLSRALIMAGLVASNCTLVHAAVDPGYVRVKTYEIRVSPNADCSNGISVFRNGSPTLLDMVNNPTLGSGTIPDGTYRCIMMQMSDFIHFTPATTDSSWSHGVCTVGADYVTDVGHDETAVDPDGTAQVLGPEGTESRIWLYIRTGATIIHGGGAQSAFTPTGGIPLLTPLVVHGDGAHTMVFDFTNAVGEGFDNGSWSCGCEAPSLSFR